MSDWANRVKTIAGWRCEESFIGDKEILDAHHIKPKSQYPELAEDAYNGKCLTMFHHAFEHYKRREWSSVVLILIRLLKVMMRRANWPVYNRRQIESYRLVHIQGLTHEEAAKMIGCSRSQVTRYLGKLKKFYPHLFPEKGKIRFTQLPEDFEDKAEALF